jgi:LPXTG-motif cell wall-anchored protein
MSPNSATVSRRTVRALVAAGLACLISGLTVFFAALLPSASATHVEPVFQEGNPTCSDFAPEGETWLELKIEPVEDGTFTSDDGLLEVTIVVTETDDGDALVFDWESNIGVDAVFVKGGPDGNLYLYDPEATEDTGLHAPVNPKTDKFFGLSHISFCYDVGDETTPPTSPPPTEPTSPPPTEPTSPPPTEPTSPPPTTPGDAPTTPTMKETTPPGEELPKTGNGNGWLAALGAGLLLGGTGLVLAGRQAGRHQA